MLHVCIERFDVMDGRGNILGWNEEVNTASSKTGEKITVLQQHDIDSLISIFNTILTRY
jgi:hypothetical protein